MDFGFTLAEEKLRQEVRDLLKKEVTPQLITEVGEYSGRAGPVFGRKLIGKITNGLWQAFLATSQAGTRCIELEVAST